MGLIESWEWVNRYGKKQGRIFARRIRAAVRNAIKNRGGAGGGGGQKCNFQYDPWSYALNFDDGAGAGERRDLGGAAAVKVNGGGEGKSSGVWVCYVMWVKVEGIKMV